MRMYVEPSQCHKEMTVIHFDDRAPARYWESGMTTIVEHVSDVIERVQPDSVDIDVRGIGASVYATLRSKGFKVDACYRKPEWVR